MGQTLGAGEPRHRGVVLRRPPELNITPGMVFREVDGTG
jgi:hypothetical protein